MRLFLTIFKINIWAFLSLYVWALDCDYDFVKLIGVGSCHSFMWDDDDDDDDDDNDDGNYDDDRDESDDDDFVKLIGVGGPVTCRSSSNKFYAMMEMLMFRCTVNQTCKCFVWKN